MNILCKAIPLFFVLGGAVVASEDVTELVKSQSTHDLVDILLVDDLAVARLIATKAVRKASLESGVPINLTEAVDGEDGWKQFIERADGFGMVITDQNMPNMNGGELANNIRQSEKGARTTIILNSSDELSLNNEGIFDSVVEKKSACQLCDTVKTFLTVSHKNSLE